MQSRRTRTHTHTCRAGAACRTSACRGGRACALLYGHLARNVRMRRRCCRRRRARCKARVAIAHRCCWRGSWACNAHEARRARLQCIYLRRRRCAAANDPRGCHRRRPPLRRALLLLRSRLPITRARTHCHAINLDRLRCRRRRSRRAVNPEIRPTGAIQCAEDGREQVARRHSPRLA